MKNTSPQHVSASISTKNSNFSKWSSFKSNVLAPVFFHAPQPPPPPYERVDRENKI